MARNGKLYISHAAEDDAQVEPFLNVLDAKTVDVWYEPKPAAVTNGLEPEALQQLDERDVFVRVLSPRTAASRRMALELAEFERLRQIDAQAGNPLRRTIINLIVDPAYERQPSDTGMTINLATMPESAWLPSLVAEAGKHRISSTRMNCALWTGAFVGGFIVLMSLFVAITYLASSVHH